jgi:preprotein translocase subunit SecG
MQILLIIAIMAVSILLVLSILIQNAKGGGIASNVGVSNQLFGAKRETEVVEKATWYLVATLAILCILSGFFYQVTPENPYSNYTPIEERGE